jgi:hypothetical protein
VVSVLVINKLAKAAESANAVMNATMDKMFLLLITKSIMAYCAEK